MKEICLEIEQTKLLRAVETALSEYGMVQYVKLYPFSQNDKYKFVVKTPNGMCWVWTHRWPIDLGDTTMFNGTTDILPHIVKQSRLDMELDSSDPFNIMITRHLDNTKPFSLDCYSVVELEETLIEQAVPRMAEETEIIEQRMGGIIADIKDRFINMYGMNARIECIENLEAYLDSLTVDDFGLTLHGLEYRHVLWHQDKIKIVNPSVFKVGLKKQETIRCEDGSCLSINLYPGYGMANGKLRYNTKLVGLLWKAERIPFTTDEIDSIFSTPV